MKAVALTAEDCLSVALAWWALGDLETKDGKFLTFPVTTALENRRKDIKEGERIKIVYRGYRKTQKGIDFKFFDVFRWTDDEAEAPAE